MGRGANYQARDPPDRGCEDGGAAARERRAIGRFRHDALSEVGISAGVLGPDPGVTAFKVQGPVAGLAITDEQSPGSASPSNPVLIQGVVS